MARCSRWYSASTGALLIVCKCCTHGVCTIPTKITLTLSNFLISKSWGVKWKPLTLLHPDVSLHVIQVFSTTCPLQHACGKNIFAVRVHRVLPADMGEYLWNWCIKSVKIPFEDQYYCIVLSLLSSMGTAEYNFKLLLISFVVKTSNGMMVFFCFNAIRKTNMYIVILVGSTICFQD